MFSSFWKLFGYNSQPAQTNPPQPAVVPKPQERINEEVHHPKPIQKQPSVRNVVDYESNFEDDLNALGSKEELKTKGMLLMSHLGENSFGKVVFSLPDIIPIGTVFVTERGNHVERISHGEVKLTTPPKAEPISKQRILHIPKADLESKEQQLSELNEKSRQEEKQEEQNKELFEKLGKKPHYFSSSSFLRNELEKIKHKGLESNKQEYEQKLEELEKDLQTQSKLGKTEIEEKKKEELKKLEEERIKEETLRKKKEEENKRAEEKKQLDELRRKQEEEKIKQKEVAEKKRKEEADRKQKEDIERKRKEEDELKRKQEEEKIKQKEAAEKKRKEELEKQQKVKEEADKKLKEEAERKQKEEADKKRELEKKQKEAEKKQKEEVDRKQKEREEDETFQSARKTSDPPRVESPDEEPKPEEDNKSKQTKKFGSQMKCEICGKTVYPAEKLAANDKWYHPQCFKCSVCKGQLKLGNYAALNGALYCKPHFKQLFMAKGNYSEGFGHLKPQQEYELSKQIKDGTLDTESNDEANKKKEELKKALEEKQKRQMEAKKKQEEAKLKQKEEVENRKKEEEEEKKILEEIESEPSTPTSTESRFATASRAKQPNKRPPTRKHIQSISYAEGKDISKQLGEGERMSKLELDAVSKSLDAAMKRRDDEKRIIEQEERMREQKERKRRDSEASQNLLMFSTAIKKKVETTYEKHLIHIKGKRSVKSRRIEVSAKAMNKGDVYILDAGKTLYIWVGPQANRMEQAKALDITTRMKNKERTGAEILTIDKNSDQYADRFWQELGGSESELSDQSEDDVAYEQSVDQAYKLYRVEGKRAIPVEAKKLTVQLLDHEKAYILDTETELYVWIGKKSSDSDRSQAMKLAKQMLTEEVRPQWTDGVLKVERIVEGGETVLFKEKFTNWADSLMISVATPNTAKLNAAGSLFFLNLLLETKRLEKYDVTKLFIPSPKEEQVFGDGNGEVMIWIINGFDKVELPKNEYGRFFSGNCYIVQYKYVHRTGTLGDLFKFIIFFWQGMDSSKNDRGTSGLLTTELTKAIQKNNEVSQSRIVQNKETAQFKTIFKGKFVVSKGTRNASVSSKSLYEVREANSPFINAIEAPLETNSLHSHGIFYVINDKNIFVWIGSGSSKESQSNASSFASILKENRELKIVYEEKEPKEFWELLGGKGEYAKGGYLLKNDKKTRFFDCSESTGIYEIDEIFSFAQEDLLDTDAIILDAFYEVYVWAGNKCSEYVKKMSMETALEYSKSIEDGRPKNIPIWLVFPGSEPVFFSCHFSAWNREKAQNTKKNETSPILVQEALKKYSQTYSLDELKNNPPKELDQTKLEKNYLSDEEFVKTFNMNKDEFSKVPDWKKLEIKKSIGLY